MHLTGPEFDTCLRWSRGGSSWFWGGSMGPVVFLCGQGVVVVDSWVVLGGPEVGLNSTAVVPVCS